MMLSGIRKEAIIRTEGSVLKRQTILYAFENGRGKSGVNGMHLVISGWEASEEWIVKGARLT